MRALRYQRPDTAESAVATLTAMPGACYLGGGTNLVDLVKLGVQSPELVVDVSRLPHHTIESLPGGGLRIGAAVRGSDLAADPLVRSHYPVLSQALLAGASEQIRNVATVGGNLLQRTRCPYFQDPAKPCNKRAPGTGCPAREGVHRNLAVLGASPHCVATHPSDLAVALAALDAEVLVLGLGGARSVPLGSLYRLPGDEPERDTVLDHGDLITHVVLPAADEVGPCAFRKARDRASFAFALVSVAAALQVRDGRVHRVRLAFGAVAAKPWRAHAAERRLAGGPATEEAFTAAVGAELSVAEPLRDNGFKVPLARHLAVAVLRDLAAGPGGPR